MAFTFIPVISAAIFYASNGRTKISYLDSLFMCTSAMTTSGLNTINLSTVTVWQQVILAILMFIGNSTSISLVVLFVRKSYFKSKCEDAVRMARQQRRERALVSPKPPVSRLERMRTRAATMLGFEQPVIHEAREDGLGEKQVEEKEKRASMKGRVRGETIAMPPTNDPVREDSDDSGGGGDGNDEKHGNGHADVSSGGYTTENSNGNGHHHHENGHSNLTHPPPLPTLTETAATPSPPRAILPELGETASPSPAEDTRGDYVSPSSHLPSAVHSRPRPRSLAVGHESDRNIRKLGFRGRAGTVRIGDVELEQDNQPEGRENDQKSGDAEEKDNERFESSPVEVSSPTEISEHATSPNGPTQFATSTLSPTRGKFAESPNEVSEFDLNVQSSPKTDKISANGALPSPILRNGSISSNTTHPPLTPKHAWNTLDCLARVSQSNAFFAARPSCVFTRSTYGLARTPWSTHDISTDGHGLGIHSRRAMLRARNGTITSPMTPHSNLPTHSETISPSSYGPDLRSPPAAHHKHPDPHMLHPHLNGISEYRRPRAHTGQGGFPSPFQLAAQWGLNHVSAVRNFVGEHDREVVKETEGRARRMSVYQRMHDEPNANGADLDVDAMRREIDEVSLEEETLEKMGGDEYNALVVLSWIVAGHYILHHALAFVILAPYSAKVSLVTDVIHKQDASSGRTLNTTWFALFSVISAYANAGLTVVDTSLIEMSTAYPMIFVIIWLILVGATAFPLSLRFFVWLGTKICRRGGSTYRGLKFLLKHPRRCFMYLFPSHQSWYLLFTLIDFVAYLTFNIDMPGIESIPTGPRVVGGILQAAGQRAGGFTTINLQAIAPALQVVYIATMFVQVYPIAMAVRTSNVYEDSGVVIYEAEHDDEEPTNLPNGRGAGFTAYVGWHLKHQLAQDLFWLVAALTTLCAFERTRILSETTAYFNIFSLFFEIVSAFANVGFSLGVSTQPYSLSGEFRTIPKLVIIGLMIRGRHRGLPMAIDRAVQLPTEYKTTSTVVSPSMPSSRRSTGFTMSRRPTVGTYSRASIRQRQRAQDPTLSSDSDE
ncbi:potassium/sodium transporter [Ceratobasidium sp. AG-Ba]|nr:potassium/sodium transporter [Ceratobasidium sp. AG-Ba]